MRIFFPYTIASIPVHRKHPKFPRDPDFQVAVAVSILRVLNVWQDRKLTNIPPGSDSELDSNSEDVKLKMQLSVFNRSYFSNLNTSYLYKERALQENGICLLSTLRPS